MTGTSRSFHLDRVIVTSLLIAAAVPILAGVTYPASDTPCPWFWWSDAAFWWILLVVGSAAIASGLAALVISLRLTPRPGLATAVCLVLMVSIAATVGLLLGRAIGGCAADVDWGRSAIVMCTISSLVGAVIGLLVGLGVRRARHPRHRS